MGAKSKIDWTEATWNPLRGVKGNWHCTHVSEGCRNCYAERLNVRLGGPAYKPGADEFRLDEKILGDPLRWKRPRMIFVCSMTDLFHEGVRDEWIGSTFSIFEAAQRHTFQVLTKRPRRMLDWVTKFDDWLRYAAGVGFAGRFPNVWLGVSAEDQKTADERIPLLCKTPAAVRWISLEPLLGPIDLGAASPCGYYCDRPPIAEHYLEGHHDHSFWTPGRKADIDWVVVGGESGPHARPFYLEWARQIIQQCKDTKVPCFVKQLGSDAMFRNSAGSHQYKTKDSKGGDPAEWMWDLRVREYPK